VTSFHLFFNFTLYIFLSDFLIKFRHALLVIRTAQAILVSEISFPVPYEELLVGCNGSRADDEVPRNSAELSADISEVHILSPAVEPVSAAVVQEPGVVAHRASVYRHARVGAEKVVASSCFLQFLLSLFKFFPRNEFSSVLSDYRV